MYQTARYTGNREQSLQPVDAAFRRGGLHPIIKEGHRLWEGTRIGMGIIPTCERHIKTKWEDPNTGKEDPVHDRTFGRPGLSGDILRALEWTDDPFLVQDLNDDITVFIIAPPSTDEVTGEILSELPSVPLQQLHCFCSNSLMDDLHEALEWTDDPFLINKGLHPEKTMIVIRPLSTKRYLGLTEEGGYGLHMKSVPASELQSYSSFYGKKKGAVELPVIPRKLKLGLGAANVRDAHTGRAAGRAAGDQVIRPVNWGRIGSNSLMDDLHGALEWTEDPFLINQGLHPEKTMFVIRPLSTKRYLGLTEEGGYGLHMKSVPASELQSQSSYSSFYGKKKGGGVWRMCAEVLNDCIEPCQGSREKRKGFCGWLLIPRSTGRERAAACGEYRVSLQNDVLNALSTTDDPFLIQDLADDKTLFIIYPESTDKFLRRIRESKNGLYMTLEAERTSLDYRFYRVSLQNDVLNALSTTDDPFLIQDLADDKTLFIIYPESTDKFLRRIQESKNGLYMTLEAERTSLDYRLVDQSSAVWLTNILQFAQGRFRSSPSAFPSHLMSQISTARISL
ncbi:unnamed protein product [Cyprideis torosa]|uniref:Uncharacterized protein n=1 Tax=Cyprideis torosa TaxID=163714 RepID=A0A7R8WH55_9CRUS|nr:unnamed protein product [Cyprideis torosa]CAG0893424.1 unnamed protein product [Cyprideis torosa]